MERKEIMPKKEMLNRLYGLLEKLVFVSLGILVALVAWVVNNYKTSGDLLNALSLAMAILIMIAIILIVARLKAVLKEIENE
jgi:uncharacterized membrane protein YcjF (UPF0283 family)